MPRLASPPIKPWRFERARLLLACCEGTAEQLSSFGPMLVAMNHVLMDRIAADAEAAATILPDMKKVLELQAEYQSLQAEQQSLLSRALTFSKQAVSIHERMRDRLEMLGADTSEFELPDF